MPAGLRQFLDRHHRLFVITGAGCSAPSGIDTYRDHAGEWQHTQPVMHQDFVTRPQSRQRYWARSLRGWPMFARAEPNPAHHALAELEAAGRVRCLVTQNVDGLHQRAGQESLIELHGSLARVVCLDCAAISPRARLQDWLETNNPELLAAPAVAAPDGDAALGGREDSTGVRIPACNACGGTLKPDVVFYGDSVPRTRVEEAFTALEAADGLLVVGSSLMVFSGFRFCRRAREVGLPMAAVNLGRTRADGWFDVKVAGDCAIVLPALLGSESWRTLDP